jgi:biotin carboxyl carrier protein
MHHHFSLDGAVHRAWLTQRGDSYALLNEDGASHEAGLYLDAKGEGYLHFEGQNIYVVVAVKGDTAWVQLDGQAYEVSLLDPVIHLGEEAGGVAADVVRAPMPGAVIDAPKAVGDAVAEGDVIIVIESMKLETAIKAPRDGVIAEIAFAKGQSFDRDAVLVRLEAQV